MLMFLYGHDFPASVKRANYEYYEPRTIHESSLSPSIHSVLASELGKREEAAGFFGFATRMDLDNYNRNTGEGLHATSIAAAWINIVYGFGGMRSDGGELELAPSLPPGWKGYGFSVLYRDRRIRVSVGEDRVSIGLGDGPEGVEVLVYGERLRLGRDPVVIDIPEGLRG
jgi:maltose phosphorylase